MRTVLILLMFAASLAEAAWNDFQETRNLKLDASNISQLTIDAGAGSLEIIGDAAASEITVEAIITVPGKSDEKAQKIIDEQMTLTLDQKGNRAAIEAGFDQSSWSFGDSPSIALTIVVPAGISLDVDDSSGSIVVRNVSGDISIDDSSGSIKMSDVGGDVRIDDGSGSIRVENVGGDLFVEDGSGSITITNVKGSVTLDDGSGSMTVKDVGKDLTIIDDGSGSVRYSNVQGKVDDRS